MIYSAHKFQIVTFEEFIEMGLSDKQVVRIYLEIKSPIFVNKYMNF